MSLPAIKVEALWKQYTVGALQEAPGTFYDLLSGALKAPLNRLRRSGAPAREPTNFWALRDLGFEIQPGEVFGVVGRNGAGKSTLLKILSRITAPTRGRITVRGRIASLLEVGTGFHPELTGRENIYLNATILGMSRREIDRKLDAIVAFSGVETFLDTPVKRYSSGMYVRLAFAVAAHVDADILLIDEVLAVGDAEFQKRCLGMMGDVARGGRTVIFVSHNLTALRNLCTTGLLLDKGRIGAMGSIGEVLKQYASSGSAEGRTIVELPAGPDGVAASLRQVSVRPAPGHGGAGISVEMAFTITVTVDVREPTLDIGAYLHCNDAGQSRVFSTGSFFDASLNGRRLAQGCHTFRCDVPGHLLNDGDYSLDVFLIRDRSEVIASEPAVLSFRINDAATRVDGWNWPVTGIVRPQLQWTCAQQPEASASDDASSMDAMTRSID